MVHLRITFYVPATGEAMHRTVLLPIATAAANTTADVYIVIHEEIRNIQKNRQQYNIRKHCRITPVAQIIVQ